MKNLLLRVFSLSFLMIGILLPPGVINHAPPTPAYASASSHQANGQPRGLADFPTVDPNYIYDQLYYVATNFQYREAGYDTPNLPVTVNGHDAFASYWSQEMMRNLQGFGPQVHIDKFPIQGWKGRPAIVPAINVEVGVPGVLHPEQVVVIGCHYDGEATSTQSANDDASGCAIELGVAKAMGAYWRSHHTFPARTLRFVIFDAEEQGLYGSFHYLNSTINGDVQNIVAMFNEEQNGIAYPLRYLGKMSNPLLPFYIDMPSLQNSQLYPAQDKLTAQQQANITHFRALMQQAIPAAFAQFQALGYQSLSYRSDSNQSVTQPIFTSDQMSNIHPEDDTLGGSDQIPFTLAGLPCATFVGNSSYYDPHPLPWSYPYDQPQDTIQLMNTFANGGQQKAPALVLALALPGMLTTWMLNQPEILGQTALSGKLATTPLGTMSDIGVTQVGQSISLDANDSFSPNNSSPLSYSWNFGDGQTASGISVTHTYKTTGTHTLTLTIASPTGSRHISKAITVVTQPTVYVNPYAGFQPDGAPPHNPAMILPTPNDLPKSQTNQTPATAGSTASWWIIGAIGVGVVLVLLIIGGMVVRRRKRGDEVV